MGVALPIEAKTAYLTVVTEAGADVAVAAPGPYFVQDDVAAALAERGVTVYASSQNPWRRPTGSSNGYWTGHWRVSPPSS